GDDMSTIQAQRIRDSRGMPEFVMNPALGETYGEALDLKGNPSSHLDWWENRFGGGKGDKYRYTTAHWCVTENRFRRHLRKVKPEEVEGLVHLEDMLVRITQHDVVARHFLDPAHRSFIPDFGVWMVAEDNSGKPGHYLLSRQLVLFCVERRKAWRLLQSKGGIKNVEYEAQKAVLAKVDKGEIPVAEFLANTRALFDTELQALGGTSPHPHRPTPAAKPTEANGASNGGASKAAVAELKAE
ncbi:MAG TPA: hypothetical protein VEI97_16975, partial [bacterium]|nr:hypothetical protein [bacterium]